MQFSHVEMPKVTHVASQSQRGTMLWTHFTEKTLQHRETARPKALRTSQQAAVAAEMKRGKMRLIWKKMLSVFWNSQTMLMEQLEVNTLSAPHLLPMGNL